MLPDYSGSIDTKRENRLGGRKGGQAVKVKGTYHCQTTQQQNALNGWDIRSVSVELPEQDKPYWHKVAAAVIGFMLVLLSWYLVVGY